MLICVEIYKFHRAEDEYSTYIRLKEKFEGAPEPQSPPVTEYERELTGYHYSDGTGICFGDMIEFELHVDFSFHRKKLRGEIVKHFTGPSYDFRVDIIGTPSMKSPTLLSITNSGVKIKKVN